MAWLARSRHLVLLAVLLLTQIAMALIDAAGPAGQFRFDLLFAASVLVTLFIVFPPGTSRLIAAALLVPALLLILTERALPVLQDVRAMALFHFSAALFIGYAVATMLKAIFHQRVIGRDEVLGAFAGYLLVGVLWGNLYGIVDLLAPHAFAVSADIRWELVEWHQRRALFNYLSFATLAGLGYADITPITPIADTLTWLEVMAAQFYMAVVIAMIVGIKLAETIRANGSS